LACNNYICCQRSFNSVIFALFATEKGGVTGGCRKRWRVSQQGGRKNAEKVGRCDFLPYLCIVNQRQNNIINNKKLRKEKSYGKDTSYNES
jgi:hypothetical protein